METDKQREFLYLFNILFSDKFASVEEQGCTISGSSARDTLYINDESKGSGANLEEEPTEEDRLSCRCSSFNSFLKKDSTESKSPSQSIFLCNA